MKKILCFGDSNTYGFNPENGCRYDINSRWSGLLKFMLQREYEVIEAGCCDRTAFSDNPSGIEQTGYKILPSYLNNDIFALILFIGINDLQIGYNSSTEDFKRGMKLLADIIRKKSYNAKTILVSPQVIGRNILKSGFSDRFNEQSILTSFKLPELYKNIAHNENHIFADINKIASVSEIDGLHYTKEEHKKIAQFLYNIIISL